MKGISTQNPVDRSRVLLAPNGEPSNLPPELYAYVRTPEFKGWFGDWELPLKHVRIVEIPHHQFSGSANKAIQQAKKWAKQTIVKVYSNEETGGKGEISISGLSIEKYLSQSAIRKSESIDAHIAALLKLPDIIKESIDVEQHPDYVKKDGKRDPQNGINEKVIIHRLYGAGRIDVDLYRIKITLKDKIDEKRAKNAHSYEIAQIELLQDNSFKLKELLTAPINRSDSTDSVQIGGNDSNNSMSLAKLLKNVEKSYEKGKKLIDHSRIVDENGEPLVLYRGQMSHANVPFVNYGDGIYFTPDRQAAIGYGADDDPIPVFLNARNPYEVDFDGDSDIESNDYHADVKGEYHYAVKEDFDILIATNTFDGEHELDQYVVIRDDQIRRIDTLNLQEIQNREEIKDENNEIIFMNDKTETNKTFDQLEKERIAEYNRRFNEELQRQIDGTLEKGHIYNLGKPGSILQSAGFPDHDIELSATHLKDKAISPKHPFDVKDVKNLVESINDPIAVFSYGQVNKEQNVIVELERDEKKFLAGIHFNQLRHGAVVSDIRGLFNRDNHEWLNWIAQGKLLYVNKDKIQTVIDKQRINLAEVDYLDLDFVAKIIKNFENPKLFDEKHDLDDDLDVPLQHGATHEEDIQSKEILTHKTEKTMQKENNQDYLQEFLATKSPLQSANMEQNLSKLVRFALPDKPRIMTNAEFVNYALDNGLKVDASEEKGTLAESKVDAIYKAFNSANENVVRRDLGSSYKATSEMLVYEQLLNRRSLSSQGERPTNVELSNARREAINSIIDANTPTKMYYHVKLDDKGTTMPISKTMYEYAQFLNEKQTELMMDKSDYKSESYSELESRVHQLTNEANLVHVPLSLRTPVAVPVPDDWRKDSDVYHHVAVTDNDILLYQSRVDSYDDKNGISITEIPDAQRFDVVRMLNEQLSGNDETVSVYVSTEHVPSYALSAIINGDFSGIDNEDDERDIRAFMEETKGMILSPREEQASFNSSPAFGLATDCVPVDVVRLSTVGAIRAEYRQTVSDEVYQSLDRLLPENADKIVLKEPFTITSADGLKEGITIDAKQIWRAMSTQKEDVFVVGNERIDGGVNTRRLNTGDLLHLRDDVLQSRQYEVFSTRSEKERPYDISYGEFPGLDNIFGDIHVNFGDKLNALDLREIQQMAEEYGGEARVMNKQVWADFTSEESAKKFAERMIEVNHEREDKLKEMDNKKTNDTKAVTDSVKGERETIDPTTDANLDVLGKSASVAKTSTVLDDFTAQKALHPNDVLFFRQKGFVEAFGPDAEQVSKALNVPLYERAFDGRKSSFVMMSINDYVNLSEDLEVSSRLVQPQVRETLQDIDKSISLMREQADVSASVSERSDSVQKMNNTESSQVLSDRQKLEAIGYPYSGKESDNDNLKIPTVAESLYWRYAAGIITLHEAAREFTSHGWTNFVDEDYTRRKFTELNQKWEKLSDDLQPLSPKQSTNHQGEQQETFNKKADGSPVRSNTSASSKESSPRSKEDEALDRFADLMIEKIESIQSDWQKPWFTKGAMLMPVNMDKRSYNGFNSLMLMLQQEKEGYQLPVWGTSFRINDFNYMNGGKRPAVDKDGNKLPLVHVLKGEKSFPVFLTSFTVVDRETKEKIKYDDYKNLSSEEQERYNVYPKQHVYNVFNIDQTNLKEARPEIYQKYQNQYTLSPEGNQQQMDFPPIDTMIKENLWICPIKPIYGDQAYYSISKQEIVVPEKRQFKDGESFFSNLFHEMGHSTGASYALDRLKPSTFGSEEYAKEELVAELTAALTASKYGMEKNIKSDSAAYIKSWLSTLKEDPSFIKTTLTDVKKAHKMIDDRIQEVSNELDKGILADFTAIREKNQSMHDYTPDFTAQPPFRTAGSSDTADENIQSEEVKEGRNEHQEEHAAKSFHVGR